MDGKELEKSNLEDEGNLLQAEPLSLDAAKKSESIIGFFGEQLCRKLFSKQWPLREEALKEIEDSVGRANADNEFRDAVLASVNYTVNDKIAQVSQRSMSLLTELCRAAPKPPAKGEAISFVENITPVILSKVGDTNHRIKEIVDGAVFAMADANCFGATQIIQGLIKGSKNKESHKNLASRLELLKEIVNNHELPKPLLNSICTFAAKLLDHMNGEVRNGSIGLLVVLYGHLGNSIRSHLSNVRPAQMEILEAEFEGGGNTHKKAIQEVKVETNIGKRSPVKGNKGNATNTKGKIQASPQSGGNVDPSKVCDFCERYDPSFGDAAKMDVHLWKECPMLLICNLCGQVVEISALTSHLLDECEYRTTNRMCPRCREAIHITEFKNHTEEMTCLPAKPAELANRCPMCHEDIPPSELGWKRHIIHEGCPNNERAY